MLERHTLVKEFPELREQLHAIKEDNYISNQMKKYEDLDKKIYSLESTGLFEDSQLEDLKKQRLEIKDML
ncbi:YdcH family protein, partial [Francisella tularensis subsp. holarctica]|uniref:YdcH family protein n=1 Tax=Francisella tularensis TaxID=263 RepID=UPI002381C7E1